MPISETRPYDGASGSFPIRVQEVAVASDRLAPQGADQQANDPAQDAAQDSGATTSPVGCSTVAT